MRMKYCDLIIKFANIQKLPPPILSVQDVSFRYNASTPWIYEKLEFGMDLDTRVALVGPNGAGKSTRKGPRLTFT